MPYTLTNGQIELGVIVIDAFSGNASPVSNAVNLTIVSVASDYNADSYSDAALYSRDTTTNQGLWLVKVHPSARRIPLLSGLPAARPSARPTPSRSRATSMATVTRIWRTTSPAPRPGIWMTRRPRPCQRSQLGTPNVSVPVVGNFDVNGPTEPAVFTINAQGQGVWTILSAITGLRTVTFGQTGDIPVPGNYDGVGYDEIAVYRPSTGQFYVLVPNG